MKFNLFFSIILFLSSAFSLFAQSSTQDVVYLKNGSVIKGNVILFEPQGDIKIEIMGGSVLVYKMTEVLKIVKESVQTPLYKVRRSKKSNHKPQNTGFFHSLTGETMMGRTEFGIVPGLGQHYVLDYHFHRLLGVGAGIGINTFFEHSFVPVYANVRGYFMKSSASLFYDLNVGYGIAIPGFWEEARGGLYLRPAIGIRFPSTRRTHVVLDFGYNIQFAEYEYSNWQNPSPVFEKRIFYRPSLRIGITF